MEQAIFPNAKKASKKEIENDIKYLDYFHFLSDIAQSIFQWDNLPNGMNERYLEKTLFERGISGVFNHSELGLINTKINPSGEINIYDENTFYQPYANLGTYDQVKRSEIALIRNNLSETPTAQLVTLYADKLMECDIAFSVNVANQKTPIMFETDTNTKLTIENIIKKVQVGEPIIIGKKGINLSEKINLLNTKVEFIADKITATKLDIYAEFLTRLGINNANQQKKERLITDEVNANNEFIDVARNTYLLCRINGAKEINEKFGTNISVKVRNFNESEESNNVNIHNAIEIPD